MKYKKYGRTGKEISVVGFGGMRFPSIDKKYDYDLCGGMVKKAFELGINYFDTAPYYNDDQSESIFGHAFKEMKGNYYVSTKCASSDGSKVRESLENSLKRLNRDKIDFFHIWCVMNMEDFNNRTKKNGAYDACLKAKDEGLIDHICFSTHCNDDEIADIVSRGLFDGMTVGYNIINFKYRNKGIRAAYENGLGVVTMNPLGGGLLPRNPEAFAYMVKDHTDIIEAAINFNISHKEITCALTGMDSMDHVMMNAGYADTPPSFSEAFLQELLEKSTDQFNTLCTGCRYCEPCPQNIEVSKYMQNYNIMMLSSEQDMKSNLRVHWRIPAENLRDCIECRICEEKCTQHLPITDRIKEMARIYGV
ncbi:MAG: aldo/keto reductase [Clostridia bacterium]